MSGTAEEQEGLVLSRTAGIGAEEGQGLEAVGRLVRSVGRRSIRARQLCRKPRPLNDWRPRRNNGRPTRARRALDGGESGLSGELSARWPADTMTLRRAAPGRTSGQPTPPLGQHLRRVVERPLRNFGASMRVTLRCEEGVAVIRSLAQLEHFTQHRRDDHQQFGDCVGLE